MQTEDDIKECEPFEKLSLKPDLITGLQQCGYAKFFELQEKALISMIEGRDVYLEASCASGKTTLNIISTLQLIDPTAKQCQALFLFPTRCLAQQAFEMATKIGQNMNLKAGKLVGGASMKDQEKTIKEGISILVGTPGRVLDFLEHELLILDHLKLIVVEEFSTIFDIGFEQIMKKIFKCVPPDIQMCICSSSCPSYMRDFRDFCLRDPVYISMCPESDEMKRLEHFRLNVENEEEKVDLLIKLYNEIGKDVKSIIHCKKNEDMVKLVRILKAKGWNVVGIGEIMLDSERSQSALSFLEGEGQIIVTMDPQVLIGVDYGNTNMVLIINYDCPESYKHYERNFEKASRFSKKRIVINIVEPIEYEKLKRIELCGMIDMQEVPLDDIVKRFKKEQSRFLH